MNATMPPIAAWHGTLTCTRESCFLVSHRSKRPSPAQLELGIRLARNSTSGFRSKLPSNVMGRSAGVLSLSTYGVAYYQTLAPSHAPPLRSKPDVLYICSCLRTQHSISTGLDDLCDRHIDVFVTAAALCLLMARTTWTWLLSGRSLGVPLLLIDPMPGIRTLLSVSITSAHCEAKHGVDGLTPDRRLQVMNRSPISIAFL